MRPPGTANCNLFCSAASDLPARGDATTTFNGFESPNLTECPHGQTEHTVTQPKIRTRLTRLGLRFSPSYPCNLALPYLSHDARSGKNGEGAV
eukprot:1238694-Amphidinium_carterae.1